MWHPFFMRMYYVLRSLFVILDQICWQRYECRYQEKKWLFHLNAFLHRMILLSIHTHIESCTTTINKKSKKHVRFQVIKTLFMNPRYSLIIMR